MVFILAKTNNSRRKRVFGWINEECKNPRTNEQTMRCREQLASESGNKGYLVRNVKNRITKQTGVKRKPALADAVTDFSSALPHDHMHLCLQSWVVLLLELSCGMHPKAVAYILDGYILDKINTALERSAHGMPSLWGRAPPRLEKFSQCKAETLKTLVLYFAVISFFGRGHQSRVDSIMENSEGSNNYCF